MDTPWFHLSLGAVVLLSIFIFLTWVLWFLLPFAVFGIKRRLNNLIDRQDEIIRELRLLRVSENKDEGDRRPRLSEDP
jgi:biopolymer transport protein ExbB/TolQ